MPAVMMVVMPAVMMVVMPAVTMVVMPAVVLVRLMWPMIHHIIPYSFVRSVRVCT